MSKVSKAKIHLQNRTATHLPQVYLSLLRARRTVYRSPLATRIRATKNDRRLKPSFFICGTRKGGTTFLFRLLSRHPQVFGPTLKEVNLYEIHGNDIWRSYYSYFPVDPRGDRKVITGESTPHYMFYPHVGSALAGAFPTAKLILVLREPASRAYSEYAMNVRRGVETLSFEEAIAQEEARTDKDWERMLAEPDFLSKDVFEFSYQRRGRYLDQIQRLEKVFPQENIKVLRSSDLFKNTEQVLEEVEAFLGIDAWKPETIIPENVGKYKGDKKPDSLGALQDSFRPFDEALFDHLGWEPRW